MIFLADPVPRGGEVLLVWQQSTVATVYDVIAVESHAILSSGRIDFIIGTGLIGVKIEDEDEAPPFHCEDLIPFVFA